jgi:hypothetical protein
MALFLLGHHINGIRRALVRTDAASLAKFIVNFKSTVFHLDGIIGAHIFADSAGFTQFRFKDRAPVSPAPGSVF